MGRKKKGEVVEAGELNTNGNVVTVVTVPLNEVREGFDSSQPASSELVKVPVAPVEAETAGVAEPPVPDLATVRSLVDLRDRVLQKARIAFGNRESALARGADTEAPAMPQSPGSAALFERWAKRFDELETECERDIAAASKGIQIIEDMRKVRGIGPMLAAKIVSMIDITRSSNVSQLWRFSGYGVIEGKRERMTKGEKLHYNIRLKTTLYLLGDSFIKSRSPYRDVYDSAKAYYIANRPDWTLGHQDAAARRRMIKYFLANLWVHWRTLEGLETRSLYVIEKLGHEHYAPPEKFGWPPIKPKPKA